jgi:hypothetical protein
MWVDEDIWGHRLYDEQSPWLTVLEFLTVLHAENKVERGLRELRHNELTYQPQQQFRLRRILFSNPALDDIRAEGLHDSDAWARWEVTFLKKPWPGDSAHVLRLKQAFSSFEDFCRVVTLLRGMSHESLSNKRWTSRFVFPFGPAALYEDLRQEGADTFSADRRFFARTGELLYLMLCRSRRGEQLLPKLHALFLDESAEFGRLLRVLQGSDEVATSTRQGAYLPYAQLPEYEHLADDWLRILDQRLPGLDALPHLVTITGLHLLLYFLGRAHARIGRTPHQPTFVLEIVSPKRTAVRDFSVASYDDNGSLPRRAVEAHIRAVTGSQEWRDALVAANPGAAAYQVLSKRFSWPRDSDSIRRSPDRLLQETIDEALKRHGQHVAGIHAAWSRAIGLASRRASVRNRYAPTDALLKSLVVCSVDGRLPLEEFLQTIRDRYGLIVGPRQADSLIADGSADAEVFSENAKRLEERLASLGLVRRLSDSCAYVENPFTLSGRAREGH